MKGGVLTARTAALWTRFLRGRRRLEKIAGSREVFFGASKRAWMGRRINILKQVRVYHRPEVKTEL